MGDWPRIYNAPDVVPFIEAFRKMTGQYYPDKIDVYKDAVTYLLKKFLKKKKSLSYIHQEVFATYVEINKKSSSTVAITVP